MSFLLASNIAEDRLTVSEAFAQGGKWFLLGMVSVFAVLGLIWVTIELFHRFCSIITPKQKSEAPAPAPVAIAPAPAAVEAPVAVSNATDAEIVAVIIAAIEAAKADTPNGKFRVVSFRKK